MITRIKVIGADLERDLEREVNAQIAYATPKNIEYKIFTYGEYHRQIKYIAILTY